LSDQCAPHSGAPTVFPGSHATVDAFVANSSSPRSWADALGGARAPDRPRLVGGVALRLRAGDAVFLHPQLAYDEAINASPDVAYALYFRLRRVDAPGRGDRLYRGFDALASPTAEGSRPGSAASSFDELANDVPPRGSFSMDD